MDWTAGNQYLHGTGQQPGNLYYLLTRTYSIELDCSYKLCMEMQALSLGCIFSLNIIYFKRIANSSGPQVDLLEDKYKQELGLDGAVSG